MNQSLTEQDHSIYRQLSSTLNDLERLANYDKELDPFMDSVKQASVAIQDASAGLLQHIENIDNNPGPIKITLFQDNKITQPDFINPNYDIKVTWSPFEKGERDPNNIIDDMIYVILGNCHGEEIEHSGHAISNKDALTFDKREFIISSDKLESGKIYQLEVEHSNMETDSYRNIEIIVTYAATTFLDFKTKGDNSELLGCPVNPYAMDGGQTDRIKKPN